MPVLTCIELRPTPVDRTLSHQFVLIPPKEHGIPVLSVLVADRSASVADSGMFSVSCSEVTSHRFIVSTTFRVLAPTSGDLKAVIAKLEEICDPVGVEWQ